MAKTVQVFTSPTWMRQVGTFSKSARNANRSSIALRIVSVFWKVAMISLQYRLLAGRCPAVKSWAGQDD
jgi:hypothetical protein